VQGSPLPGVRGAQPRDFSSHRYASGLAGTKEFAIGGCMNAAVIL